MNLGLRLLGMFPTGFSWLAGRLGITNDVQVTLGARGGPNGARRIPAHVHTAAPVHKMPAIEA